MGIDVTIRNELRTKWIPSAFSTQFQSMKNAVVIEDVLTRVFLLYGPSNGGFTGDQFFEVFYQPIREAFDIHKSSVYIAICDDQRFVPKEKEPTQHIRTERRSQVEPYPEDTVIGPLGIKTTRSKQYEPFETQRLFRSRHLRIQVWEFIVTYLKQISLLPGQTIIFDFDNLKGPWVFRGRKQAYQSETLKHSLGEADLGIPFFINLYPDNKIFAYTSDTDILPVSTFTIDKEREENTCYWVYLDKAQGKRELVYVDLIHLRNRLPASSLRLSKEQFFVFCLISGTDYIFKTWWLHRMRLIDILDCVRQSDDLVTKLRREHDYRNIESSVKLFVKRIYSIVLNRSSKFIRVKGESRDVYDDPIIQASMHSFPSLKYPKSEDLKKVSRALLFNYHYWKMDGIEVDPYTPTNNLPANSSHNNISTTQTTLDNSLQRVPSIITID